MEAAKKNSPKRKVIGEILVEKGLITEKIRDFALRKSQIRKERIGKVLVTDGHITERDLAQILAEQFEIEFVELSGVLPTEEALALVPQRIARQHTVLPVEVKDKTLTVVCFDPATVKNVDTFRKLVGMTLQTKVAAESEIKRAIESAYSDKTLALEERAQKLSRDLKFNQPKKENGLSKLLSESIHKNELSIESLVNEIIEKAVSEQASDIHIEATADAVRVRQRIFGELEETAHLPIELYSSLIARLKILGNIDIAEKRKPQDGSFQHRWGSRVIDLRLSTLPTIQGEKAVLRILDKTALKKDLVDLGMDKGTIKNIANIVSRPHGMLLVTGPTGSGKTTTIYSLLTLIDSIKKNVVTIEDPVEYKLENINQVQINNKAGVNFPSALRSILRQDPDIIMVGEIRDQETAEIAIRAALTGHLVISTLHTNDSVNTITRLLDMGIEPFLVASSLLGVLSQRLVRVLCPACKKEGSIPEDVVELIGDKRINKKSKLGLPGGCDECRGIGFDGRQAIYELLEPDSEIKRAINNEVGEQEILQILEKKNFQSMREQGIQKVLQKLTSVEEILRVTL